MPTKTTEEILRESTAAAQRAAQMIGGTFEQGRFSPTGELIGGFTPITSSMVAPGPATAFIPAPTPVVPTISAPTDEFALTPEQRKLQEENEQLRALIAAGAGETAFGQEKEVAEGVPQIQATQRDLTAQLNAITKEAQAIPLGLTTLRAKEAGISTVGLGALQRDQLRETAVKSLTVSSLLEATRGNLATAQEAVDRAVAQKYGPIKEQIDIKIANLDLILKSPAYTQAEKRQAQEQKNKQEEIQRKTAEQETTQKRIWDISVNAAAGGAGAEILRRIQNAQTEEEALRIAQPFLAAKEKAKTAEKVIAEKDLTQNLRMDIIDTLTDEAGLKALGRPLELIDLIRLFPDVETKTLEELKDKFLIDVELDEKTEKNWWQFWK